MIAQSNSAQSNSAQSISWSVSWPVGQSVSPSVNQSIYAQRKDGSMSPWTSDVSKTCLKDAVQRATSQVTLAKEQHV